MQEIIEMIKTESRPEIDKLDSIVNNFALNTGGNDAAVAAALSNKQEMFATTSLYFDCDCAKDFIHPSGDTCPNCGYTTDDGPDSRINEVIGEGLPLDMADPTIRATLNYHSYGSL